MKLVIASDKSGFYLKEAIKAYLTETGVDFDDLGTQSVDSPIPYFECAAMVSPLVANGDYDKAILICGTGAGMAVVANKFYGVYAVACESLYSAKMCRSINNANVLCMGGWIVGPEMGVEMAKAFIETEFLQGLEQWRQTFLTNAELEVKKIEEKANV
ncbi:MAG: RpiB/LacA/LacB family sugar-phosphate isomerase [Clostridia bacterium]